MTWLALASLLAVLAFAAVLVSYLAAILRMLERIGGTPTSYLAKIRMGVRAIESETAMLAPKVTRLNEGASVLLGRLRSVAADLDDAAEHLGGAS